MTAHKADGPFGQVQFDGELVKITHEGWRASGPNRDFVIADVARIDFKEATAMVNGHIRFAVPGVETKRIASDPNAVVFPKKSNEGFVALNELAQRAISERGELSTERMAELTEIYSNELDEANRLNREESKAKIDGLMRKMAGAVYDGHIVDYKGYRYGLGFKRPISGATAEFESGADRSRPTLTRIGAGALLAGPVGAIAGGMFKKDKTKGYVTIVFPDGATVIIEGPAKDEKKMRTFAQQVNAIANSEQQLAGGVDTPTEQAPVADQLLKLKQLHDAGVLTAEQYDEKSAPLISQL